MNFVSIAETVLFNFPLEQFDPLPEADDDLAPSVILRESVDRALSGSRNPAILLSAGYDSRVILAAALRAGYKPVAITWNRPNPSDETGIAKRIADQHDLSFLSLDSEGRDLIETERSITEFAISSRGRLSTSRALVVSAMRKLKDFNDVVLWGEGELVRPPVLGGEYLSEVALSLLLPSRKPLRSFTSFPFNPELPYKNAIDNAEAMIDGWAHLSVGQKLVRWLINQSYPGIYGVTSNCLGSDINVKLPFMDRHFMASFLKTGRSIADLDSWLPSLSTTMRGRKLYYELLSDYNLPKLLTTSTDRGYPPSWDRDIRGMLATLARGIRARTIGYRSEPPSRKFYQECLVSMLSKLVDPRICHPELTSFLREIRFPITASMEYDLGKLLAILLARVNR